MAKKQTPKPKKPTTTKVVADPREFRLKIPELNPDALPMKRLSDYMAEFARLLGSTEKVHFDRLEKNSTELVSKSDLQEIPKITRRLELVKLNGGVAEARTAFKNIDDMLVEDNATAQVTQAYNRIIVFPGRRRPKIEFYESVPQHDSVDGVLITIGGKDASVPVHLEEFPGRVHKCNTSRDIARRMAPHLFGKPLRVYGEADWMRDKNGVWVLKDLIIEHFIELDVTPMDELVARLRLIKGNHWPEEKDPYALLHRIRYGDDEKAG